MEALGIVQVGLVAASPRSARPLSFPALSPQRCPGKGYVCSGERAGGKDSNLSVPGGAGRCEPGTRPPATQHCRCWDMGHSPSPMGVEPRKPRWRCWLSLGPGLLPTPGGLWEAWEPSSGSPRPVTWGCPLALGAAPAGKPWVSHWATYLLLWREGQRYSWELAGNP